MLSSDNMDKAKEKVQEEKSDSGVKSEPLPFNLSEEIYMALMSLSILVPSVGWVLPVILWLIGKDKSGKIDIQGKYIINWLITYFVVIVVISFFGFPLMFFGNFFNFMSGNFFSHFSWMIFVGFLINLWVFIIPIIGTVKNINGEVWKYPASIGILK
jgi:Uncharacterized protein conserved in bacteria